MRTDSVRREWVRHPHKSVPVRWGLDQNLVMDESPERWTTREEVLAVCASYEAAIPGWQCPQLFGVGVRRQGQSPWFPFVCHGDHLLLIDEVHQVAPRLCPRRSRILRSSKALRTSGPGTPAGLGELSVVTAERCSHQTTKPILLAPVVGTA